MKLRNSIFAFMFATIFLIACDKDSDVGTSTGNSKNIYFPLEVGNYWEFNSEKRVINSTKVIGDKTYFVLTQGSYSYNTYWRVFLNRVYKSDLEGNETLYFDLSANVNDTWTSGLQNITLTSKSTTVIINEKEYTNCYSFYFDIPYAMDDEHTIILAPNIGYIAESISFFSPEGMSPYLEKSRISGEVTVY